MKRTFAIGDIHGGYRAIYQLIKKLNLTSTDHLVFLGDFVDGWSESFDVITYLIALQKKYNCTFIRGNHDQLFYNWLQTNETTQAWLANGGQTTLKSYASVKPSLLAVHIEFFKNLKNYYVDSLNRLFIHAGFTNQHGPDQEYFEKMHYWDRTLWELAIALDPNLSTKSVRYPKRLQLFNEIYIGHTPVTKINKTTPVCAANVWNVDTGAAFKGPITAINVDTKEWWQSDPVYTLYPSEEGRN
ncbi:metallophosphoesterase family protein [Aquimarina sp. W85]|uniref:metallophosphoesterase family protein n=1 Tax=Aquimarina rhodophyticola TaxID=3342246 RepID=UPI00366B3FDC